MKINYAFKFPMKEKMNMSKAYKVEELAKCVADNIKLRTPKEETVADYAEAMHSGIKFPPVTLGYHKGQEKKILVDGLTRLRAAQVAGITVLDAVEKEYASLDLLLADMYLLNKHGVPISHADRDARIKMLAGEPYKWTQSRIAKEFGLDQSSVSRILEGKQKGGQATGEAKSRKTFKPLTGKAIIASALRMAKSLKLKPVKGDIAELCYIGPITDRPNPKNGERLDILKDLYNELKGMFDHLEALSKPTK
jgi:hypothetical protein